MRNNSCCIDTIHNDHDELEQFLRQFDKKEEMSESDWIRHFMPFDNPNSKNMLFDHGDPRDAAFLAKMGERHIWTEVDSDRCGKCEDTNSCGFNTAILPGIRIVNRIGYIVTLVPWDASHRDMIVLDDGCEREA